MRDVKEGRKKQARLNNNKAAHPRQSLFLYKHTYMYCRGRERNTRTPFHCSLPSLPGSSRYGIQGCPACPSEGDVAADTEGVVAADTEGDVAADTEGVMAADTEGVVAADTERDVAADTERDVAADTERDVAADSEGVMAADTAADTVCNQSTVEHRQYITDLWELVHGTFYLLQAEHVRSLVCDVLQSPILWNSFSHTKYPTPISNTPLPYQIPHSHTKYPTPISNTPVPYQIPHSHTKYPTPISNTPLPYQIPHSHTKNILANCIMFWKYL